MCGIAGVIAVPPASPPTRVELERMIAVQSHRGPDGWGLRVAGGVGLAHVRLAIIDPAGGAQPMTLAEDGLAVTYNGEVFDHLELRRELERAGRRFRTHCDTEVLLHAYAVWGESAWNRLNGQFAFALHDTRRRCVWLVRDRWGIIPLYYARHGGALVFASEVKGIAGGGRVSVELGGAGLSHLLTAWAPVAPWTVFRGVRAVPPGSALRISTDDLSVREQRYWTPEWRGDGPRGIPALDAAVEELSGRLRRAVALRLRADVPVGAYLSGGIDSSLIANRVRDLHEGAFATYSVRFDDPRFDEGGAQAVMVSRLASRHRETVATAATIAQLLPRVVWHAESPLLRTAPAPLLALSALVRSSGMKVVLTGEGADELLAGYNIFREAGVRRFWARRPDSRWRAALLARLYPYVAEGRRPPAEFWRGFFGRHLDAADPWFSHRIRWENTRWIQRFFRPEVLSGVAADPADALEDRLPRGWREWDALSRAQAIEMETFLAGYLLAAQGDRVALAHGVEVRYPFLDPDVADLCMGLAPTLRLRALSDKRVLRRLAARELPPEVWARPKRPYRAPAAAAFTDPLVPSRHGGPAEPVPSLDPDFFTPAARGLLRKAGERPGRLTEREEMAVCAVTTGALALRAFGPDLERRVRSGLMRLRRRRPHVVEDPVQAEVGR